MPNSTFKFKLNSVANIRPGDVNYPIKKKHMKANFQEEKSKQIWKLQVCSLKNGLEDIVQKSVFYFLDIIFLERFL